MGANFHNFRTQTCFRGNKNKLRWRLIKALCACQCEQDDSLQSVCSRNSRCREESACYHTKCQQICKRRYEVLKVEISSAKFFCSTSQFLLYNSSPDAFGIVHKKGRLGFCCTSLLLHFIVQCHLFRFGVVRASCSHSTEIKTVKRNLVTSCLKKNIRV